MVLSVVVVSLWLCCCIHLSLSLSLSLSPSLSTSLSLYLALFVRLCLYALTCTRVCTGAREKFTLEQDIRETEDAIRHKGSEVQVGLVALHQQSTKYSFMSSWKDLKLQVSMVFGGLLESSGILILSPVHWSELQWYTVTMLL